jgi:hypothetical protein
MLTFVSNAKKSILQINKLTFCRAFYLAIDEPYKIRMHRCLWLCIMIRMLQYRVVALVLTVTMVFVSIV